MNYHDFGIILILSGIGLFPTVFGLMATNILPEYTWDVCFFVIPISVIIIGSVFMYLFPDYVYAQRLRR